MPIDRSIQRATFSLPADIRDRIDALRKRAAIHNALINNSEIIRAGIAALEEAKDAQFRKLVNGIDHLRPGPVSKR